MDAVTWKTAVKETKTGTVQSIEPSSSVERIVHTSVEQVVVTYQEKR